MKKYVWGLAAIAIMVIGFALPSQAASFKIGDSDWSLGGSVRLDTGWRFSDFGDAKQGVEGNSAEIDNKTDFFLENPGDSRVFMKAVNGKMTGYAELGISSDVSTRHIYATYDMGGGNSLLVGQTWTLVAENSPNQLLFGDDNMEFFGDLYLGRNPQIRFEHSVDKLSFKVAIQEAQKGSLQTQANVSEEPDIENIQTVYDVENIFPALCLAMTFDDGKFSVTPSLYAQQLKLRALAETGPFSKDITVTTYALAVDAAFKADTMTISGELWWGQNVAVAADVAAGLSRPLDVYNADFGAPAPDPKDTGSDIENVNSYGGWLQLAAPIKPGTMYVGAGYQNAEVNNKPSNLYEDNVSTWGAFINYEYQIAKGFTMTPELAYFDYGNAPEKGDNDLGTDIFVGVHFQYDF